ncbi:MAG: carboxylating nicotinate-nucleotide diphosphorylase [Chloroflexota bacterium]
MDRQYDGQVERIIDLALAEDTSYGDITSRILIPPEQKGRASVIAGAEGVLAGGDVVRQVFLRVNPALEVEIIIPDGKRVKAGDKVITVAGSLTGILKAERVALNFLSHLSGIASETAGYVARIKDSVAVITDTRKTLPGLRVLEKYPVRLGGGQNHRFHLGDGILIKDNHIAALRQKGLSLKDIITGAKKKAPEGANIEIEVNTIAEAMEAAAAGVDIIMLDNMPPDEMKQVAKMTAGQVKLEASGGINLDNVHAVAKTGVDFISVGAITHSARAIDFSLELELFK